MIQRCVVVCAAVIAAVLCMAIGGQAAIAPPRGINYAFVQMQFVEISKIDGVEQAFHADFFMVTSWLVDVTNTNFTSSSDLLSADLAANLWNPSLEFINARDEVTKLVKEPFAFSQDPSWLPANRVIQVANLTLDPLGIQKSPFEVPRIRVDGEPISTPAWLWVTEDQRYQCDFTTPLEMESFPYDQQFMQLLLESFWDDSQVQIEWAEPAKIVDLLPDVMAEVVGWNTLGSIYFPSNIQYDYNSRAYNRLSIRTLLEREPQYYLTKIVAGSMLLVYMGAWVFALGIDEADRMMGSLQIFGGLITYLFVAGEDTPKVPYQTRLDVFMMFSFFCVAAMLFIHGLVYYWRECDIEDFLEGEVVRLDNVHAHHHNHHSNRPHSAHGAHAPGVASQHHSQVGVAGVVGGGDLDFALAHSPLHSPQASPRGAPHLDQSFAGAPQGLKPFSATQWFLRKSDLADFSLRKWWRGLHLTRKIDAVCIPGLMIIYSVGVAIIFGRSVHKPALLPPGY